MSALSDFFLTALVSLGAPLFGFTLFLGACGIPLPTSLLVVATGAFSRQGLLSPGLAAILGLAGAVAGDSTSFALGRWGGSLVNRKFGGSPAWLKAQEIFSRNARLAVFLTRFILTPVAIPVNLLAGASCHYPRFLVTVLAGEAIWILGFGGLGYLFGSQWELISDFLSNFGGLTLGIALVVGGVILLLRRRRDRRAGAA